MKSTQHVIRNDLQNMYVWIYGFMNGAKDVKSRAKRALFSRYKKGESVLFLFLYPFIFLSLPSFLYFLPSYMAWGDRKK